MDPPLLDSAFAVISKGKKDAADHMRQVCASKREPQVLEEIMDILFDTSVDSGIDIANRDIMDWCCWLIAGGRTPEEFGQLVRKYDNASTCGLVWTANFVAYRCRTCGISPCMSLCAECFKKGNHQNHDYNMFRSQAGGACDCGDVNVMREAGFCSQHQRQNSNQRTAPDELLAIAEIMMPRIILRLIQFFREKSEHANPTGSSVIVRDADGYLSMLLKFSMYGAAMHRVLAGALINPQVYKKLTQGQGDPPQLSTYMEKSKELYEAALETLLNPQPPEEYKDCLALQKHIVHCSFLEELMFWNIKYEFPQKLVCLMLNMLPEPDYKEALTHALVLHYSRVSMMLERSGDTEMLSNRVVHMSVQLFSNQRLAMHMVERLNLLNVMIFSLKYMMNKSLIPNTLHEPEKNYHSVVDCALQVLKEHCYWPLVSDWNNVLSHRPVALRFMEDDKLLESWFAFLSMFQGMNVNQRETSQHIEFEPSTYYASFSAELEASAYPMWALVSHLNDASMLPYTKRVISRCLAALRNWLEDINFTCPINKDVYQVSFHLPLHRYLSVFMCQAIRYQGMSLQSVFPEPDMLYLIMFHPLRAQAAFYEIMCGMWVRNGLQIKGQAMTYIQSNFCNSMVDADLYLLQVCATQMPPENFLNTVLSQFHMRQFLSVWNCPSQSGSGSRHMLDAELDSPMLESCLLFLATLASTRVNLGENEVQLSELEMVTLLCMGDKTHSQLIELMPDRCGTPQNRDYEALLAEVADYNPPNFEASGNMLQGMYRPKPWIWEKLYDPIHVLLRAVHRRDFQNSMDRYTEHVKHANKYEGVGSPWPPFRTPAPCHPVYESPAVVLRSRVFHALVFIVLHKATLSQDVSDQVVALTVFLLELALQASISSDKPSQVCQAARRRGGQHMVTDGDLNSWYDTDCIFTNVRTTVNGVVRNPETNIYDSEDSEPGDWETGSLDGRDASRVAVTGTGTTPMLQNSLALAPIEGSQPLALEHLPSDSSPGSSPSPSSSSSSSSSSTASSEGRQRQQQQHELSVMRMRRRRRMSTRRDGRRSDGSGPSNDADGGRPRWKMLQLQGEERREERREEPPVEDWALAVVGDMAAVAARVQALSTEIVAIGSEMETAVTPAPRKSHYKKRPSADNSESVPVTVNINESIISLLLKLHSSLSEAPDSFNPADPAPPDDHLIGDGPFFIGRVLRRIMALDDQCSEHVAAVREQLWSKQATEGEEEQRAREELDREERRKRARERQQKLMAEFANQQKDFMAKAMETEEDMEWEDEEIAAVSKKEYDCVICSQTTLNTPENPMGLVVLVQATSVLGHKHEKSDLRLPTNPAEQKTLFSSKSLAEDFNERLEVIQDTFNPLSWQLALSLGWEGGVHLQTCGHHLHLNCLTSYLSSLRSQQQRQAQTMIDVENGEYSCPLCRQLANSVLPLAPELSEYSSAVVRSRPLGGGAVIVNEIGNLLREMPVPPPPPHPERERERESLPEAMKRAMEDMTNCTFLKFNQKSGRPTPTSLFLFVTSIARTNLELELVQRGGTLVSSNELGSSAAPKRACVVPLFHVLAMHARVLAQWSKDQIWQQLATGFSGQAGALAMSHQLGFQVPLLLHDPIALLMQFVLLLPLHIDQAYFRCVVQVLYNLLYFQVLAHISCRLTDCERRMWRAAFPESRTPELSELTLEAAMSLIIRVLEPSQIYVNEAEHKSEGGNGNGGSSSAGGGCGGGGGGSSPPKEMESTPTALFLHRRSVVRVDNLDSNSELLSEQEQNILLNKKAVEQEIQELCLPFLRIAALLKQHIYELSLPEIQSESGEFLPLVYYLELVTEGMDINKFNSAVVLSWPAAEASSDPLTRVPPHDWAQELATIAMKNVSAARVLLRGMHHKWQQPCLLSLPQQYDSIFQFHHRQKCKQCGLAPPDATLCLLCGTLVCFKEHCCQQEGVSEVVRHAKDCGAGTSVFLVVTTSCIIVVRGKRACNWGSVYLDSYGEEDRELKRGKPLFLSAERYQLLQQQWLSHRFNHIDRKWVWHRGTL